MGPESERAQVKPQISLVSCVTTGLIFLHLGLCIYKMGMVLLLTALDRSEDAMRRHTGWFTQTQVPPRNSVKVSYSSLL